jgi:hypothetical protein
MIILGQFDEFASGMGSPSIKEFISSEPFEHKDAIVAYMKTGHVSMTAPGFITDVITGKQLSRQRSTMHDDVYTWSSSLIYHVETYNVKLPADFVEHVLTKLQNKSR